VTLREYVDVARDRWRFVLAGLLLGLLAAGAVTVLIPREYSADVTMIVSAPAASTDPTAASDGESLSAQRVRTYVELMRSKRLAGDVIDALDLPLTPDELASRITATSAPETVLLTASVTGSTPQGAIDLANVVAAQFIKNVAELEQPENPALAPAVVAKVFEPAAPPAQTTAPRPTLYLTLGAVLGLLVGFGAALLRNGLDTTLKRRAQLEESLDAPVLGVIGRDSKIVNSPLVIYGDPQAPLAEAFRQLRTNVQFMDVDTEHKVILVTSASSGEGKSTTVCNLGLALAEAGTTVLIIDADLRRPSVAKCLGVDGSIGLTNVLVNRVPLERAVQPLAPALDVLPSGLMPPNPSELLGSERMVNLLLALRGSYDVILIDTSPLLPVTDAAVLAPRADGVLVMVRHGRTKVQDLQSARDALDAVSARVLGSVLTMAPHTGKQTYRTATQPAGTSKGRKKRGTVQPFPMRSGGGTPRREPAAAAETVDIPSVTEAVPLVGKVRPSPTARSTPPAGNPQQPVGHPQPSAGIPQQSTGDPQLAERGGGKASR
jgi:capsular exopolysaccharide synthesis family protein